MVKHKRPGIPPVALARQRARYSRLKAARMRLERGIRIEGTFRSDDEQGARFWAWLSSISPQVIARRKLRRMEGR